MTNAFALLAAAPLMFAQVPAPWVHQSPAHRAQKSFSAVRFVNVNIVRGQVHRLTSPGPAKVLVQLRSGQASDVQIEISQVDGGLAIRDIYPQAPTGAVTECLPDGRDRGAFWSSDVILDVTVSAPAPLVVRQHVMDERPIMRNDESAAAPEAAE
jgi:hypothetical protein